MQLQQTMEKKEDIGYREMVECERRYLRYDKLVNDSSFSVMDCDLMIGSINRRKLEIASTGPHNRRLELRRQRGGSAAESGRE